MTLLGVRRNSFASLIFSVWVWAGLSLHLLRLDPPINVTLKSYSLDPRYPGNTGQDGVPVVESSTLFRRAYITQTFSYVVIHFPTIACILFLTYFFGI